MNDSTVALTAKDLVLRALDEALSTPVVGETAWQKSLGSGPIQDTRTPAARLLDTVRAQGAAAQNAAEAEAQRLGNLLGSFNSFSSSLATARATHADIEASMGVENLDGVLSNLAEQYVGRWRDTPAIRQQIIGFMGDYVALKTTRKTILGANDAELKRQQAAFDQFVATNKTDLEKLGVIGGN
jgi:hypothetical protein